ncbi:MAG: lipoyl synthase [Deltaproteobacteria bacterium]|nr:lipoyl synthase [Deltaproteobacteria bacterium]
MSTTRQRKPDWLKVKIPAGERYRRVRGAVRGMELHTVCQEARCPNVGECWEHGTATFLILGVTCTRGCRFCAVSRGDPGGAVDRDEPGRVATAALQMELDYVVITSVTRDDLTDGGASVFADSVAAIKALDPAPLVELLIPDLRGSDLEAVLDARPDVLAHNIEVVEHLTQTLRHARFDYRRSLSVLEQAAARGEAITKSSIMVGLGETAKDVISAMRDLRGVGVRILVLGQYLQPTRAHAEVVQFVPPEQFDAWADQGREMGFEFVAAGPLVRTSYRAAEAYSKRLVEG